VSIGGFAMTYVVFATSWMSVALLAVALLA
jgi:hypothetical protein